MHIQLTALKHKLYWSQTKLMFCGVRLGTRCGFFKMKGKKIRWCLKKANRDLRFLILRQCHTSLLQLPFTYQQHKNYVNARKAETNTTMGTSNYQFVRQRVGTLQYCTYHVTVRYRLNFYEKLFFILYYFMQHILGVVFIKIYREQTYLWKNHFINFHVAHLQRKDWTQQDQDSRFSLKRKPGSSRRVMLMFSRLTILTLQ